MGENFRIFPLSNWTEMDVWQYIAAEKLDIPDLYLAHERNVVNREGVYLAKINTSNYSMGRSMKRKRFVFAPLVI